MQAYDACDTLNNPVRAQVYIKDHRTHRTHRMHWLTLTLLTCISIIHLRADGDYKSIVSHCQRQP